MASFRVTCLTILIASLVIMSVSAHHPPGSPCWEKAERGSCNGKVTRYFHNHDDDKCEPFVYSGCGGNGNNFNSYQDCQKACAHAH
ncbi:PI-actitoxin-Axm2b-like isoform X3 [Nilaparvata lugens]|uniref:PI-actitoxin-Axm2b-like isoform X1 n=1 Tax=Nilaparvata lugens TaxID=108931 RepID=UPI00193E1542|nr:PI-actitoxin-Axm2b-like isoform X1 [Nilaparvata lugens]XP_039283845.1 PI-actitoxin-Axm2b-like isoform X2 [Nilaparvata lugens]XP_039283847.1 PI-actitoxin-Axm2b-like isoform X3 [Nilaparvata lugens]